MDTLTIIIGTIALAATAGLAWIGGYQHATHSSPREVNIDALIEDLNNRRPKAAKNRRKAQRKAVRA